MFDIKKQLSMLPSSPGVYIMKDAVGDVIYVGKAKSLKNRVRQYFQNAAKPAKVESMVKNIAEFEYIITDSELEALILECNLIKKYRPKYNVIFMDDKTYPFIKVTVNEEYPRILKVRSIRSDGAKYFGPYTSEGAVNDVIRFLKKLYPIRRCKKDIRKLIKRGERHCLNYDIGVCSGPCRGIEGRREYMKMVDEIVLFLSGKSDQILKILEESMKEASRGLEFEKAAYFRDKIESLKILAQRQKIVSKNMIDQDFVGVAFESGRACIQVFFVREGKIMGREHFIVEDVSKDQESEVISSFIKHFYSLQGFIPKEIIIPVETGDEDVLQSWIEGIKGQRVYITVPQKGDKKHMVQMVQKNAREAVLKFSNINKIKGIGETLEELCELIGLESVPRRIEAFDISNIQGVDSVGSMVVFTNGKKDNREYRRFKIKNVEGPDDYSSMCEIIHRRFKKWDTRPELIFVDGGKGQVGVVKKLLDSEGIDIPVWGIFKDDRHNTKGIVNGEKEIVLKKPSSLFKLIASVQDEMHRFAITYHRSLRQRRIQRSIIDEIPGVGRARKLLLLSRFKTVENIKNASIEELKGVEGINAKLAEHIYRFFREEKRRD
ncbi:Excinuclease ABC subunit C [Peptoclostridium litorale DSM 5388]|uniref:UvrABC system protein C n=1 Tax=Peptoclostridium litorale DSM 5388 TaxID=1121324 RepID=A0A069RF70_PEPLI|nr:excinuclease ABC subunit UvrC [Peptoclostridium litorale]KDR94855.1 UvrABC system protein C [Peptoclostridium litorale DSM 5388]SIN94185.1 Excinuclease ABC subunit C [Peptoclostridium litorale DSM 5388]